MRRRRREHILGGEADFVPFETFDPDELRRGTEHELEHTSDPAIAREIAADHLAEDPRYYTHLEEMEQRVKAERGLMEWERKQVREQTEQQILEDALFMDIYGRGR